MSEYSANSKILVSSDGTKIYADASGSPDKPSIVFVHGQALSAAAFDIIFSDKRYTEDFYLVRTYKFVMTCGHGRSDKPDGIEGYASKLVADDFAAVVKAFNLHRPVLVGWSLGGAVGADVTAHLPEDTLAGLVYIAGVPYIGPILSKIGSPEVFSMIPPLQCEDSVDTFVDVAKSFVDSCFVDATKIPWELKCFWIGMAATQRPVHCKFSLVRPQDPTRLFELGQKGLPALVLGGKHDRQVYSKNIAEELRPYFKDIEVCIIDQGGSHAVFIENPEEVMERILNFTRRVQTG